MVPEYSTVAFEEEIAVKMKHIDRDHFSEHQDFLKSGNA